MGFASHVYWDVLVCVSWNTLAMPFNTLDGGSNNMITNIVIGFFFIVVFSFVAAIIECEHEAWMHRRGFYYQKSGWIKYR